MLLVAPAACNAPPPPPRPAAPAPVPAAGSGSSSSSPPPAPAPTTDSGCAHAGSPPWRIGACDIDTAGAARLVPRVLLEGDSDRYVPSIWLDGLQGNVFTDPDLFASFLSHRDLPVPTDIDFATESAVVVAYGTNGTCWLRVAGVDAWDVGGAPHVSIAFTDDSWACCWQCDMAAVGVVVVAVPNGAGPTTACGSVGGGCGQPP